MAGYHVKEIFYSLQGEGAQAGRPAVFCRFTGCNLWSGREPDRALAACPFCDTDFVGTDGPGGGHYPDANTLAQTIAAHWPSPDRGWVILTGGEPLLQLDEPLIQALRQRNLAVAVETNGTHPLPAPVDWLCVSPKAGADTILRGGDELKLVYPQPHLDPETFLDGDFRYFFLQPQAIPHDPAQTQIHVNATTAYCLAHPRWRLSAQLHKWLGIP